MTTKRKKRLGQKQQSPLFYAMVSLTAFIIGIGLLFLFIFKAGDLVAQGVDGKVFYILLLPLGLSASAFLFGVMSSYAAFKGKVLGSGILRLGGPVVLFLIVIILGFELVPDTTPFDFSIFLRDAGGKAVLTGIGEVRIKLENELKSDSIDEKGCVNFKRIPANFKNTEVIVELEAPGWQFGNGKTVIYCTLEGNNATLIIDRDDSLCCIFGSVSNGEGKAIVGAKITIKDIQTSTGNDGLFSLSIPREKQQKEQSLSVIKKGYKIWENFVYPETKAEVKVVLQREDSNKK